MQTVRKLLKWVIAFKFELCFPLCLSFFKTDGDREKLYTHDQDKIYQKNYTVESKFTQLFLVLENYDRSIKSSNCKNYQQDAI